MITRKSNQQMITAWRAGRRNREILDQIDARMADAIQAMKSKFQPRPEAATIGLPKRRPGR